MLNPQTNAYAFDRLRSYAFVYVATPYSRYPGGLDAAFIDACKASAELTRQGIKFYCPIAHSHPIAMHGGLDALDYSIWMPMNETYMEFATALAVVTMPGWEESFGVNQERKTFHEANKPEFILKWDSSP